MSTDNKSTVGNSFVGRWSKRKLQVKAEQAERENGSLAETLGVDEPTPVADVVIGVEDSPQNQPIATVEQVAEHADVSIDNESEQSLESQSDEEEEPLLTDEQMPDIATLDSKSDVSPFFNRGVSTELRKAALRHIFSLPVHNIRDGLNDYDEDYTVWEPLGDTVTCDMKFHERRKEKERLEKERLAAEEAEAKAAQELEDEKAAQEELAQSEEEDAQPDDELVAEDEEAATIDTDEAVDDAEIEALGPEDNSPAISPENKAPEDKAPEDKAPEDKDELDTLSTDSTVTEHA